MPRFKLLGVRLSQLRITPPVFSRRIANEAGFFVDNDEKNKYKGMINGILTTNE
jgi:hypothetical protein